MILPGGHCLDSAIGNFAIMSIPALAEIYELTMQLFALQVAEPAPAAAKVCAGTTACVRAGGGGGRARTGGAGVPALAFRRATRGAACPLSHAGAGGQT